MKKKLAAILMTAVMAATLLTACGDAPETNDAVSAAPEVSADGSMISEETYNILKENWTSLANLYNEAAAIYNEAAGSGEMERDESFENLMNQVSETLQQMNTISPEELTQDKAVEINDTMIRLQEEMAEALGIELID